MPWYSYKCPLQHITDLYYKITEKPDEIDCPKCNLKAKSQIVSGGGFILIGDGWTRSSHSSD